MDDPRAGVFACVAAETAVGRYRHLHRYESEFTTARIADHLAHNLDVDLRHVANTVPAA